ncbi:MAG: hypothetical protein K2X27_14365 [Candidatus Obscuribacterales bacterium]|nr:hypothetical protein [Candidatus Obscuribacterales bacterium]
MSDLALQTSAYADMSDKDREEAICRKNKNFEDCSGIGGGAAPDVVL